MAKVKSKFNFKKILVAAVAVVIMLVFTGCSSGVDVYEYSDGETLSTQIEINIDVTLNEMLDRSGAVINPNSASRATWTLKEWLVRYFTMLGYDRDMEQTYLGRETISGVHYYMFRVDFPLDGNMGSKLNSNATLSYEDGFFFRTYSGVSDNRFNVFQQQFKESEERKSADTLNINDYSTETGIILNGMRNYYPSLNKPSDATNEYIYDEKIGYCYVQLLPSLAEALPAINMATAAGFNLNSFWQNSSRMKVSSDKKIDLEDKQSYYYFHKTLGDDSTVFEYSFVRALSLGWFITSLILGGLAVGGVILFCYLKNKRDNKKKPPQVTDLFPYDPFS